MGQPVVTKCKSSAPDDLSNYFSLLRLIAVHPFNKYFNLSHFLLVYFLLTHLSLFSLSNYIVGRNLYLADHIIVLLYCLEFELTAVNIVSFAIGYLWQRNKLKAYIADLQGIDDTLLSVTEKKACVGSSTIFVLLKSCLTVTALFVAEKVLSSYWSWLPFVTLYFSILYLELHLLTFKTYTLLLTKRFELTTWCLKNLPPTPALLESLIRAHNNLIEMAHNLNSIFSLQLLVVLSSEFYLVTSSAYNLIWEIIHASNWMEQWDVYAPAVWVCLYSRQVFHVIQPISALMTKSEEFTNALNQILMYDDTRVLADNATVKQYTKMGKKVKFTAYGYFSIGYPLITAMVGASTTYLVILLQMAPPATVHDPGNDTVYS